MASSPLGSSNVEVLWSSRAALDRRWATLSKTLSKCLFLAPRDLQISPDYQSGGVWAGLCGNACERIARNMGGHTFVAPFYDLPNDIQAWIGFQEVWDAIGGGAKPFAFRQLGLTLHLGFPGDPLKPQIFRSEWVGVQDWSGEGIQFHPEGAGHPHWQFDLMESLRGVTVTPTFDPEAAEVVEEFGEGDIGNVDIGGLIKRVSFEKMHFASAALWWAMPGPGGHMNAPNDEGDLTRWLERCLAYIRQELARCEVRPPT